MPVLAGIDSLRNARSAPLSCGIPAQIVKMKYLLPARSLATRYELYSLFFFFINFIQNLAPVKHLMINIVNTAWHLEGEQHHLLDTNSSFLRSGHEPQC